jgi:hypothetical protein
MTCGEDGGHLIAAHLAVFAVYGVRRRINGS